MKRMLPVFFILLISSSLFGQDMWKYFSPEDFQKRRAALMDKIPDGVAIFIAAELPEPFAKFYQDNTFYYLTGVEIPDAVLILNGKTKKSYLYVPEKISNDIKKEAWILPGKESAEIYRFNNIFPRAILKRGLAKMLKDNSKLYLYLEPQEIAGMSPDRSGMLRHKRFADPWDARIPQEVVFANHMKEQFPANSVVNIAPFLHEMRWIKDEKEIALLRECGRIGALGFNEAMKVTRPGLYEYQVVAACNFFYAYNGTIPAFYAIAASGERGLTWHYNANNHLLQDGDVILLDYAPDLHYYDTDITRTWPVNGKFSAYQLKMYSCIKETHLKVIAAIKPGITISELKAIAKKTYEKHGFSELWPNYIGHFVGMAVHDVGPKDRPFKKGVVFNVEPIIENKEKKIHFRIEDTILVTKDGAENLTNLTPLEPAEIYKMIAEKGLWEK